MVCHDNSTINHSGDCGFDPVDPRDRRWKFVGNVVESLRFGGASNVRGINCTKTEADSS